MGPGPCRPSPAGLTEGARAWRWVRCKPHFPLWRQKTQGHMLRRQVCVSLPEDQAPVPVAFICTSPGPPGGMGRRLQPLSRGRQPGAGR